MALLLSMVGVECPHCVRVPGPDDKQFGLCRHLQTAGHPFNWIQFRCPGRRHGSQLCDRAIGQDNGLRSSWTWFYDAVFVTAKSWIPAMQISWTLSIPIPSFSPCFRQWVMRIFTQISTSLTSEDAVTSVTGGSSTAITTGQPYTTGNLSLQSGDSGPNNVVVGWISFLSAAITIRTCPIPKWDTLFPKSK